MYALRNVLPRAQTFVPWLTRMVRNIQSDQKLILEPLNQRQLVRVSGRDIVPFLQGLTTNDMKLLETVPAIFTMFLNKAGRVLYDAIVYRTPDPQTVLIECDKEVSEELKRHLTMFLVRRKIDIDNISDEAKVWVLFNKDRTVEISSDLDNSENLQAIADPRLQELGLRLISQSDLTRNDLSQLCQSVGEVEEQGNSEYGYKQHRYTLGVAEGIADLQPNKLFPLEANCDLLNGVCFNKGCYIGQELTARVHHTGVIRKRHMPLQLDDSLPMDSEKIIRKEDGTKVGKVLGDIGKRAIGLVRIEQAIKNKELFVDNIKCNADVPQWWPPEVLNHASRRDVL